MIAATKLTLNPFASQVASRCGLQSIPTSASLDARVNRKRNDQALISHRLSSLGNASVDTKEELLGLS